MMLDREGFAHVFDWASDLLEAQLKTIVAFRRFRSILVDLPSERESLPLHGTKAMRRLRGAINELAGCLHADTVDVDVGSDAPAKFWSYNYCPVALLSQQRTLLPLIAPRERPIRVRGGWVPTALAAVHRWGWSVHDAVALLTSGDELTAAIVLPDLTNTLRGYRADCETAAKQLRFYSRCRLAWLSACLEQEWNAVRLHFAKPIKEQKRLSALCQTDSDLQKSLPRRPKRSTNANLIAFFDQHSGKGYKAIASLWNAANPSNQTTEDALRQAVSRRNRSAKQALSENPSGQ